ncbi:hypothetical protein BHE74_00009366 [Ensete ventricosum]|nr:hypothetical protein GW17_00006849 [Ensete ventricosum]RWW82184.1 hypothetical protein BHE74_00009366 [Ensete ventricosum]
MKDLHQFVRVHCASDDGRKPHGDVFFIFDLRIVVYWNCIFDLRIVVYWNYTPPSERSRVVHLLELLKLYDAHPRLSPHLCLVQLCK